MTISAAAAVQAVKDASGSIELKKYVPWVDLGNSDQWAYHVRGRLFLVRFTGAIRGHRWVRFLFRFTKMGTPELIHVVACRSRDELNAMEEARMEGGYSWWGDWAQQPHPLGFSRGEQMVDAEPVNRDSVEWHLHQFCPGGTRVTCRPTLRRHVRALDVRIRRRGVFNAVKHVCKWRGRADTFTGDPYPYLSHVQATLDMDGWTVDPYHRTALPFGLTWPAC